MHTGMILIDLQKTSDTLDYKSHFEKITCLDFKTSIIKNFEPYLSKKFFFVSVNDFFLGDRRFKLFLKGLSCSFSYFFKYINDLPQSFSESKYCLYAYDKFIWGKNIRKIEAGLNKELATTWEWFFDQKLSSHFVPSFLWN